MDLFVVVIFSLGDGPLQVKEKREMILGTNIDSVALLALLASDGGFSFFLAATRLIELGPCTMLSRDIIVVLFGGVPPYVVRRVYLGRYAFVGNTNFHEIWLWILRSLFGLPRCGKCSFSYRLAVISCTHL